MYFPECSFTRKQREKFLAWDDIWETLICLVVLDTNRFLTRCRITSMQHQESVSFQASLCFIGNQILYFLLQN